jgi:hypothetical protein
MYKISGDETIFIIELKIYPDNSNWHIYSLYVGAERPAYRNKCPIIFFDLNNTRKAINSANCGAERLKKVSDELIIFDFYRVIKDLENPRKKKTTDSQLLNCLNLIEDYCFDTMDIGNISNQSKTTSKKKEFTIENTTQYKTPISSNSIPLKYDFFRKIFAATFYFFNHKDIDKHFHEQEYGREKLIESIKIVIGTIAVSAFYIT